MVERRKVTKIIKGILSCYGEGDELHHGNASGVDRIAAEIGKGYGIKVIAHPAIHKRWDGKGGYKERNIEIVNSCDKLYAFHSPNSLTGGTIWTYNHAKDLGKQCEWVEIQT